MTKNNGIKRMIDLPWLNIMQVTETGVEVLTARLPTSPDVFPWLNK